MATRVCGLNFSNRSKRCMRYHHVRTLSDFSTENWKQPCGFETGISIYNPIVKKNVPLILRQNKILTWYVCGPTVYDNAHIGHASAYVRQDVIRRIIQSAFHIDCVFIMGITDVDDKIIAKSNESGRPVEDITREYESEFFSEMSKLNVLPPCMISRVTQHIPAIIDFVRGIENKGLAYKASDGSVYFDVNKYGRYGVFSNPQNSEQDDSSGKKSSKDFVLWKASKPREVKWGSPWGEGRPGWHIECSAMASTFLGSNFDLHSGGEDNMFPHHENEIAQSCAFHDTRQWVNYWIHTGQLYLSGQNEKMSKSLKNVVSVPELLDSYTSNHFRMLCLLSSYRKRIDFSDERMHKALTTVKTFVNFINNCDAYVKGKVFAGSIHESELYESLDDAKRKVLQAYADNFNTPQALACMMRLVQSASQVFGESDEESKIITKDSSVRNPALMSALSLFIKRNLKLLGLEIGQEKNETSSALKVQFDDVIDLTVDIRENIRNLAKNKKQFLETATDLGIPQDKAASLMKKTYQPLWNASDEIRTQLLKRADVEIRDSKDGSSWTIVEPFKKEKD